MAKRSEIPAENLMCLIAPADCLDRLALRLTEKIETMRHMVPASIFQPHIVLSGLHDRLKSRRGVTVCQRGRKFSHRPALQRMAEIIRDTDSKRAEAVPVAEWVLARFTGFSRRYRNDNLQFETMITLYDACFRRARDAFAAAHDWPTPLGTEA